MSIQQTIEFAAGPDKVYETLMSGSDFGTATGAPAEIATDEGGEISCFGGKIIGRNIELKPGERIVQAWRAGPWPDGVYSIVRFEIRASDAGSTLEMEHSGFPDGEEKHLEGGWQKMYWQPLQAYLG